MLIGESDFRHIIQGGNYLVDKSLLIQEVIKDSATVLLITRPRRFGKTLNLSMLRYFFSREVDSQGTQGLFDGFKDSGNGRLSVPISRSISGDLFNTQGLKTLPL
jgi:hypothetical protein